MFAFFIFLYSVGFVVSIGIIIYLIKKRIEDKKEEKFEKRDF